MTGFDAELYLRLCGERGLINRDRNQGGLGDRALLEAARALISVGAIEGDEAAEIVAGYALARGFRDGRGMLAHYRRTAVRPPAPTPPTERRIVSCNTTIERPTDVVRVRSVTLSESETRLSVVIQSPVGTRSRGRRAGAIQGTFTFQVADDRGGRSSTTFGGGGSDHEWRGQLTASQPLAVDTAWIELDGTRIELDDSPGPHAVTVERLPDARPVESFLWHWLATPSVMAHTYRWMRCSTHSSPPAV